MKPSSRTTMLLAACCLVLLSLSACSIYNPVADFVGQRYTNVISYFNTYYNAQRAFNEAEADVMMTRRAASTKNPQSIQSVPVSSVARQKFNTAIEKGSKLLSYYPTCKWVDNTLLMIGKSYFYLEDDLKAERKFLELLAQFPESSLIPEVELLYGRSLLRQKKISDGLQRLNGLLDRSEQVGNETAGEAASAIGLYHYGIPDYVNAAKYFDRASALMTDGDAKAQSELFAGLCADQLGDYVKAEKLFRQCRSDASDYNQMFEGELQATRMLTKQKRYDEAIRNFSAYLHDAKNADFYGRIHLMIGQIAMEEQRYDDAVAKFTFIDTTFARTDESAHSYYSLARYFETVRSDYAKARLNYDKARAEFSSSEVVDESTRKADMMGRYFQIVGNTARYDSLIVDMLMPKVDSVHSDSLGRSAPLRSLRTDSLGRNVPAASPAKQGKRIAISVTPDSLRADSPAKSVSATSLSKKGKRGPILSMLDSLRTDSLAQTAPSDSVMLEARVLTPAMLDSLRADSLKTAARWHLKLDSLQRMRVRSHQELAGLFYLELVRPDSALYWY
ncbi:MAG: tetratricopeptide repeat protein, partial [Ignavibacteriales bacterium]|nr:tetratricopeptide repeat protein [Ignavibacteriales bacterium]